VHIRLDQKDSLAMSLQKKEEDCSILDVVKYLRNLYCSTARHATPTLHKYAGNTTMRCTAMDNTYICNSIRSNMLSRCTTNETALHRNTSHHITLPCTIVQNIMLHDTSLRFITINYMRAHCEQDITIQTTLYTTPGYITLHYITP
jgi:hypothetical protein